MIHQLIVIPLLLCSIEGFKNMTDFWKQQLNHSTINFQAYAGFESIDWFFPKNQTGMFYTLFGATQHDVMTPSNTPLIIWLQGGPGASSQLGAFTELGPIRIRKQMPQQFSSSWNHLAHLLFIDSPLNVGFSYNGDRKSSKQISTTEETSKHLLNFLHNFYKTFPSLKWSPLYIAGQSYGGHYVPNFANTILSNSTFLTDLNISVEGIIIGDGWVDPLRQVNFYDSYLWSVGVVSNKFRDVCTWYQTNSMLKIYEGEYANATSYFDFLTSNHTTSQTYMGNISLNNFRNYDGADKSYTKFLNKHKNQFGSSLDMSTVGGEIYSAFAADISKSFVTDLIYNLRQIKVLIYNGQNDVIVNTAGVLNYLNSMNWEGISSWKKTSKEIWTRFGEVAGWNKIHGNLWFVLVNGAGHMVPTNQPEAAFNMIDNFLKGQKNWKQ